MPDEAAERTHQPSPRKLQKARSQGRVPRSKELDSVVSLTTLVITVTVMSSFLMTRFSAVITDGIHGDIQVFVSNREFMAFFNRVLTESMGMAVPIMAALVIAGVFGSLLVGGFTFSAESLKLRWDSVNPAKNIQNMMTSRTLVTLVMSIAKLTIIGLIIWFYLRSRLEGLAALRWASPPEILGQIGQIILGLCIRVCVALLSVALADILYQKWKYTEDLRMTTQEVKQENKDTEGSQEVRARVRQIRVQLAMQQMARAVPQADVVLVNPTHYAVALKYDGKTMSAPVVLAKGVEHKAAKIREIARAYGIPIIRRPELTRTIYSTVDIGKTVPEGLFMAVAEVLAVIYRLRKQRQ
ncbi:flagellar biosynthesis protein FlhB [Planctomycetota bacterium]